MTQEWKPREYQLDVMRRLCGRRRAAIWLGCGSGKTAITLTWLQDEAPAPALVVAPKLVVQGWLDQMARWRHLGPLRAGGVSTIGFDLLGLTPRRGPGGKRGALEFRDRRAAKAAILALPGGLHMCSWDAFPWVELALGRSWPYRTLVLDESSFAKDQSSARGRAARRAVHGSGKVECLLELTATPASNHDEAVYAQLDLIERGCLGANLTAFRNTFCVPDARNWATGQTYTWKLAPAMRPQFEAVCARLAISAPDNLGIDVLLSEVPIVLPDDARAEYRALARDGVLADVTAATAATLFGKLRQLASAAVYTDDGAGARWVHETKIERAAELVDEIAAPVIIAFQWEWELAALRKRFGTRLRDIREPGAKEAFQAGQLPVLAMHPAAGGHGVDGLQDRCNNIVWLSVPVDREHFDQANGRLKRAGQDSPTVFVHALVAQDTVEQDIWREVLPGKATLQDLILRAARKDEV